MAQPLRLAVCLFPGVTALDYQGPMELLGFISPKNLNGSRNDIFPEPLLYSIDATYLSHDLEPVEPTSGPQVLPNLSYGAAVSQYDIILVPGGPMPAVQNARDLVVPFLKRQAPGAQYVLSVCTGSWLLAKAGILDGMKATTNKSAFRHIAEDTKDLPITWVKKARWVVDDDSRLWTSSGVTAGQDLGHAFMEYLIGKPNAEVVRNICELSTRGQGDDEFAAYYGLLDDC